MTLEYLAHLENEEGKPQTLIDHLNGVATKARQFAAKFDASEEGHVAGLLHDVGKFRNEFQQYLRKERSGGKDTHHAVYGAAIAFIRNWPCSFAIAGHHAGLHDVHKLQELVGEDGIYELSERLPNLESLFLKIVGEIPQKIRQPAFCEQSELSAEFYIRMLFSCLVDADYLDTEEHYSGRCRPEINLQDECQSLFQRIVEEIWRKPSEGLVNKIRHSIFEQCLSKAGDKQGVFSLTVPTGGGKTLSSMAFALAHARKWNLDRIVVVIPYLSIIEQNAAEYRRILDPENRGLVVEHHSATSVEKDSEIQSDSLNQSSENWDRPIIITTSVQFIETLFSSSPSKCRKLHNIVNSLVIFDEVQTLPVHLLNPLLNVIRELKENYKVTFLLMTATQPAFRRHPIFLSDGFSNDEVAEVCEDTLSAFNVLSRVDYSIEGQLNWQTLAERMADGIQALCIVNVRKHAFELWDTLRNLLPYDERDSVFHLSSAMCAEHRMDVLGDPNNPKVGSVRHRLKFGLPCRVVATQVVEAGVDLDFPRVFRAMGPLDSIVQAAGRCNREGQLADSSGSAKKGRVLIFEPENDSLPSGIYRTASIHTKNFLLRFPIHQLATNPHLFKDYFSELFEQASTDVAKLGLNSIQEDRRNLRFRTVSQKARVISDAGMPVVVGYGHGRKVIEDVRSREIQSWKPKFGYLDLRRLQRFIVNIRDRDIQRLLSYSMLKPLLTNINLYVLEEGCYHNHLGVLIEDRPLEDFIQ